MQPYSHFHGWPQKCPFYLVFLSWYLIQDFTESSYVHTFLLSRIKPFWGLPWWLSSKESTSQAGDMDSIPRSGRSPEEEMATHSSILAWRIPWTEEPGGLQSTGCKELDATTRLSMHAHSCVFIWCWLAKETGQLPYGMSHHLNLPGCLIMGAHYSSFSFTATCIWRFDRFKCTL